MWTRRERGRGCRPIVAATVRGLGVGAMMLYLPARLTGAAGSRSRGVGAGGLCVQAGYLGSRRVRVCARAPRWHVHHATYATLRQARPRQATPRPCEGPADTPSGSGRMLGQPCGFWRAGAGRHAVITAAVGDAIDGAGACVQRAAHRVLLPKLLPLRQPAPSWLASCTGAVRWL